MSENEPTVIKEARLAYVSLDKEPGPGGGRIISVTHVHSWEINEDGMRQCGECGDFDRKVKNIKEPVLRERDELHDAIRKGLAALCSIETRKNHDRGGIFEHYCNNHHRVCADDLICPTVENAFESVLGMVQRYNNGDY